MIYLDVGRWVFAMDVTRDLGRIESLYDGRIMLWSGNGSSVRAVIYVPIPMNVANNNAARLVGH